jgi:hypothetical protein
MDISIGSIMNASSPHESAFHFLFDLGYLKGSNLPLWIKYESIKNSIVD